MAPAQSHSAADPMHTALGRANAMLGVNNETHLCGVGIIIGWQLQYAYRLERGFTAWN